MNITIIAPGSRGDVQPYVALGKGLQGAGHAVTILAYEDFQDLTTSYGLAFVALGGSVQAVAQSLQALLEQGDMLKILSLQGRAAQQMSVEAATHGLVACRGADLIVAGLAGLFVGLALSEKLGIPFLQAHVLPFSATRAFPSVLAPPLPQTPLTSWANSLSHRLTHQILWQTYRVADNKARRTLQLAPAPFWGPFDALQRQAQPILYGYSPQVLAPPPDWDARICVSGYWFLDPPAGWEPPSDLLQFLQDGPPPIYVGFGSMPNSKPAATADLVVQALARAGQRGVLSAGWGGLEKEHLPESVFMIGSVPHSWLFPRMAAVVHHGGAGTTAAGVSAGIPSIVTPFFGDQPFWAQRVYALGVGPKPIPRRRLTVDNLAEALRCAASDEAMQRRAAALGERIRAEDGIARAVALIEQGR